MTPVTIEIELGMTVTVRECPEEGTLVTIVYDPFLAAYKTYREEKPVIGENLCNYADYCKKICKPVDADVVGPSLDLHVLNQEGFDIQNLPGLVVGFKQYGRTFFYN